MMNNSSSSNNSHNSHNSHNNNITRRDVVSRGVMSANTTEVIVIDDNDGLCDHGTNNHVTSHQNKVYSNFDVTGGRQGSASADAASKNKKKRPIASAAVSSNKRQYSKNELHGNNNKTGPLDRFFTKKASSSNLVTTVSPRTPRRSTERNSTSFNASASAAVTSIAHSTVDATATAVVVPPPEVDLTEARRKRLALLEGKVEQRRDNEKERVQKQIQTKGMEAVKVERKVLSRQYADRQALAGKVRNRKGQKRTKKTSGDNRADGTNERYTEDFIQLLEKAVLIWIQQSGENSIFNHFLIGLFTMLLIQEEHNLGLRHIDQETNTYRSGAPRTVKGKKIKYIKAEFDRAASKYLIPPEGNGKMWIVKPDDRVDDKTLALSTNKAKIDCGWQKKKNNTLTNPVAKN